MLLNCAWKNSRGFSIEISLSFQFSLKKKPIGYQLILMNFSSDHPPPPTINITVFWKLSFQWYVNSIDRTVFLITEFQPHSFQVKYHWFTEPVLFKTMECLCMNICSTLSATWIWALYMAKLIPLNLYIFSTASIVTDVTCITYTSAHLSRRCTCNPLPPLNLKFLFKKFECKRVKSGGKRNSYIKHGVFFKCIQITNNNINAIMNIWKIGTSLPVFYLT